MLGVFALYAVILIIAVELIVFIWSVASNIVGEELLGRLLRWPFITLLGCGILFLLYYVSAYGWYYSVGGAVFMIMMMCRD